MYSLNFSLSVCVFIVTFITFAPSHALLYVAFTCGVLDSWTDVNTTAVLWDCLYLCVTLFFSFHTLVVVVVLVLVGLFDEFKLNFISF